MRAIRTLTTVVGAAAIVLSGACASGPSVGELGPNELFERGMTAYEDEDWQMAIRALDRLAMQYPTHPRVEEARFRLADAYFGNEEYVTAADEFVRFATDYSSSGLADDARFRTCRAYEELSPDVHLDQNYTHAAVEHCSALVSAYPGSEYSPRAREIVGELRDKLARKLYVNGDFYFERNAYDSAIVYFDQVVAQHPESSAAPEALLRLLETYTTLGYAEEAEEVRERLLNDYPESAQAEEAEGIPLASGL